MNNKYKVIGIMSGTSLDGLDIAYCDFFLNKKKTWQYKILFTDTLSYNKTWKQQLSSAFIKSKREISDLDKKYGKFIGEKIHSFIKMHGVDPDFIASHGHTIFHQPEKKFTLQIGDGFIISSVCRLPVICDFRSGDVALGGQGAPLVPVADKLLFPKYDFCLNLGGFANISYDDKKNKRLAFDICPVNIVLNDLANKIGKEYDTDGKLASAGKIHADLLNKLNNLAFYKKHPPKSLGREWVEKIFMPVLNTFNVPIKDKLRTVCEHIAMQIALAVNVSARSGHNSKYPSLLITGGGAYNKFLLKRISFHSNARIILPDDKTIQFKEAMAFAFLGVLRIREEINILKSVTGAARNSSGGKIFFNQKAVSSL